MKIARFTLGLVLALAGLAPRGYALQAPVSEVPAPTAPAAADPYHVLRARALQDFGLPAGLYLQDPSTIEENQAFVQLYSQVTSSPTLIGGMLLDTLQGLNEASVRKITRKKLFMLLLAIKDYVTRARQPIYQAHPELLGAYKERIQEIVSREVPEDTDYAGLGPSKTSWRDALAKREEVLQMLAATLERGPAPAAPEQIEFLKRVRGEMATLRLASDGNVLVPTTLIEIVRTIPESELTEGQWKAIFESYPLGHSLWENRVDRAWRRQITGKGVTIALLDTGADKNHPYLKGRLEDFANFTNHRYVTHVTDASGKDLFGTEDNRGKHGTHMGSIAAGLAPDARILNIKALDEEAEAEIPEELRHDLAMTLASIKNGLRKVYEHNQDVAAGKVKGPKIDVVSMSLGVPESNTASADPNDPDQITEWVKKLAAQGVVVVAAAGNEGMKKMGRPGYASEAITVGAVDYFRRQAPFSSNQTVLDPKSKKVEEKPDVFSYGVGVRGAAYDPAGGYDRANTDQLYSPANGTSPATPHVAAAAAMLIQAGRDKGIDLTPDQIKTILKASSAPLANGNPYAGSGGGVVRIDAALAYFETNFAKFKQKPN